MGITHHRGRPVLVLQGLRIGESGKPETSGGAGKANAKAATTERQGEDGRAVDALNAVHIALRLAAAGKLDAELLVATRNMVRQTLEVVSKTERTTEVKEIG